MISTHLISRTSVCKIKKYSFGSQLSKFGLFSFCLNFYKKIKPYPWDEVRLKSAIAWLVASVGGQRVRTEGRELRISFWVDGKSRISFRIDGEATIAMKAMVTRTSPTSLQNTLGSCMNGVMVPPCAK